MQTSMLPGRGPRAAKRSALGYLIAPLLAGRTDAEGVFRRYFQGTALGRRLYRALRYGSLVDGQIHAPRFKDDPDAIARPFRHRVTRRMLAAFLMHVECMDPSGTAAGRGLWQGGFSRRLQMSTRELQRYVRLFDRADVIERVQPNADNVPNYMRGAPKLSRVKGREVLASWAYSKIRAAMPLPKRIADVLRRWRGELVPKALPPSMPVEVPPDLQATITGAREAMAYLKQRLRPS